MRRLSLVILSLLVVACGGPVEQQKKKQIQYPTMVVDTTSATIHSDFAAELQSAQVVEIRPRVSGYIDRIAVSEGAHVTKGQLLFEVNQDDLREQFNAAQAEVDAAQAQVANAQLEVEKLTPLVRKGIISAFELQNAESNLVAAVAKHNAAKSQARNAKISIGYASITSPVNGVVGRIVARSGTLVSPSTSDPLTAVSADGPISAYFSLDENSVLTIAQNSEGENLRSKIQQLDNVSLILSNGELYPIPGKLELASGIMDMTTGSMQIKGIFPNPDGILRTGASAKVRLNNFYRGVITVPQSATQALQEMVMVYKVSDKNVVSSQTLKIFGVSGTDYVVSDGLKPGERILTEGLNFVKEGDTITIKK